MPIDGLPIVRILVEKNTLIIEPIQEPNDPITQAANSCAKSKRNEITWKTVAERTAVEWAARAGATMEEILRFFGVPGY